MQLMQEPLPAQSPFFAKPWKLPCNPIAHDSEYKSSSLRNSWGKLSWLDVEANWYCLIILLIGLMLLANEKSCHKNDRGHYKTVFAASSVLSMFLIILSMLLTYTAYGAMNIGGVQGRYFLPLRPLLIFCCHTNMVTVTEHQANKLYMVMFSTESLILLQAFACI